MTNPRTVPRENPERSYEICAGCGSPDVEEGGYCAGCRKQELDLQRVESSDRAIEHGMGIVPFRPVSVPRPSLQRDAAFRALDLRREARHAVLAAAGIAEYDEGAVTIDRHQDERRRASEEAWLKRVLATVPGQH